MNKSRIYLVLAGAICSFMLWDMADYFVGGLGFPRGDWESYTFFASYAVVGGDWAAQP